MKLSPITKRMIQMVYASSAVMILIGAAVYRSIDALYFAVGVILMSSLNVFKIWLLEKSVRKTLDMDDPDAGKNYVKLQYLARYFLTAAVLFGAGLITMYVEPPFINVWGALAGAFTLQIAVIISRHMKIDDE